MKRWKEYLIPVLSLVVVISILEACRKEQQPQKTLSPEQAAVNACADEVMRQHLKDSLALDEQHLKAISEGKNVSSIVLLARREKESSCYRLTECYKLSESARGMAFEACLAEEI